MGDLLCVFGLCLLRHDQNGGSLTETFESGADSIINAFSKA